MTFRSISFSLLGTALGASALSAADADLPFLHPLFSDHAILQRDQPLPVWGWTVPGERVTVDFAGASVTAVAGSDGRWQATLPAHAAGGPYALHVSGSQEVTCSDVLLGDLWLCSGQSNMEWVVQNAHNWPAERAAAANCSDIRQFRVPKTYRLDPTRELAASWRLASTGVGQFTAVGYFFARNVQREVKVPIGLINASWGGTTIEAWTSQAALEQRPFAADVVAKRRPWTTEKMTAFLTDWWQQADPDHGQRSSAFDASSWSLQRLPGMWKDQGVTNFSGIGWYRRDIELPAAAAIGGTLSLGITVDADTAFINGVEMGSGSGWDIPRLYRIPRGILTAGRNTIALRIHGASSNGGIYGQPEQLTLTAGGASYPLAGEWRFTTTTPEAQVAKLPRQPGPHLVGTLWNGMIAPLIPASVKGVLWYQGETNAWTGSQYDAYLTTLITDWRLQWHQPRLPFGIVQLANFGAPQSEPVMVGSGGAYLRDCQRAVARSVPDTGLTVIMDLGDPKDVHPRNKQDVGQRLAAWALHDVYGRADVVPSGPLYSGFTVEGSALRLQFTNAVGLNAHGDLTGFAIADDTGPWHMANARIDGETVVVQHPAVAHPTKVRYAWADSPQVTLYNAAAMPASTFRSDR
jgi:sialate O-acetylesterase